MGLLDGAEFLVQFFKRYGGGGRDEKEKGGESEEGAIHLGADDNASGAAALMMLGESLRRSYDELPEDMPLRSIMFAAFDAEESGLNGSHTTSTTPRTRSTTSP